MALASAGTRIQAETKRRPRFLAAYLNLHELFDPREEPSARERSMATHLDRMAALGLNTLLPYATSTSGDALYPSAIIPRRVYGDWDGLRVLVREAGKRHLRVYPVHCAMSCGGEQRTAGVLLRHPEWALRDEDGKALGFFSPAQPEARKWVASVSRELVERYQPDGLLLDYLRFPNRKVQLDPAAAAVHPLPSKSAGPAEKAAYQEAKETALTEQAKEIGEQARQARPDLDVAIYSWGPHVVANHSVSQNWRTWVQCGHVNRVNISGYCFTDNYGAKYLEVFEQRLRGALAINASVGSPADISFALGVRTSHGQIKRAADVGDYLQAALKTGVRGTALFTWGHLQPHYEAVLAGQYLARIAADGLGGP